MSIQLPGVESPLGGVPSAAPDTRCPPRDAWILLGIFAALMAGRIAIATRFELFQDEALYAWLGRHAPFSFCPHPPGIPLLSRLGIALLGKREIGVRLLPMALTALMPLPYYLLARRIGGSSFAFWCVAAIAATPLHFGIGAIITPDGTQFTFWTMALYFTWRALESRRARWWLLAGATIGLGLFVKYILILYFPALALCLLLSPAWRGEFKTPRPCLCLLTAMAIILPAALWHEWATDWSAVRYHLLDRQSPEPPTLKDIGFYQVAHAAYVSPLLYISALAGIAWAGVRGWRARNDLLFFLFSFSAVPYLFFLVIASMTERELSREQWDAPAYVTGIMAGVLWFRNRLERVESPDRRRRLRRWAAGSLAIGYASLAFVAIEGATGFFSRLTGQSPVFRRLIGWRELAGAVDREFAALPRETPVFFAGRPFSVALAYSFYGAHPVRFYTTNDKATARYGVGGALEQILISPETMAAEAGRNAIVAKEATIGPLEDADEDFKSCEKRLSKSFGRIEPTPYVEAKRYGRIVRRFFVLRCFNLQNAPEPW